MIFVEALPSIISGLTLTLIFTIGFSALAGTVGGGGLGDVAIRYGYERFNKEVMIQTVVILLVLVQMVQILGNLFYIWAKNNREIFIFITISLLLFIKMLFSIYNDEAIFFEAIVFVFLILSLLYKLKVEFLP